MVGVRCADGSRLARRGLFVGKDAVLEAVQKEYMRLAAELYLGNAEYSAVPMKDRDIFDLLGFD